MRERKAPLPLEGDIEMAEITAYRVQDQRFGIGDLLDPERMSFAMSGDDELARRGVSCMEDLPSLAAYIAVMGIEATVPALVRVTGVLSEDTPVDEEYGEILLIASDAEIDTDDDAFFSLVGDLVDLYYEKGLGFEDLREIASDRI